MGDYQAAAFEAASRPRGGSVDQSQPARICFDISPGEANTIEKRSPCMPELTRTGAPVRGPCSLEAVFKRRLYSQIRWTFASRVTASSGRIRGITRPVALRDTPQARAGAAPLQ